MSIKLLDNNNIKPMINRTKDLLLSYRYFICKEKDIFEKFLPMEIAFDDNTSEFLVAFESENIRVGKRTFDVSEAEEFPLFLENIFDKDSIEFLSLAIRSSELCAKDNHIYLYYDNIAAFYLFLCLNDVDKLLESEKFVFLIGEEAKTEYPLDFKSKYGIDYSLMQPEMLHPDELFRICYFLKGTFSGADFVTNVIAQADDVILVRLWSLHNKTTVFGVPLDKSQEYIDFINDVEQRYETQKVISYLKENKEQICFTWSGDSDEMRNYPGDEVFIDQLEKILCEKATVDVTDIFKAYFIAKDYFSRPEKAYDYLIVPCLLFEPHLGIPEIYTAIFESFEYKTQLSGFRDPLKRLASGFRRQDVPPYGLNLPVPYLISEKSDYRAIKFEDLKLNPKEVCKRLCEYLNIRFTDKMLSLDYGERSTFGNMIIKGYDVQPVIRPVDDVLGIFDQIRLRYYFKECTSFFEYPVFFGEELSDEVVEELLMIPFTIFIKVQSTLSVEESSKIEARIKNKFSVNYIKANNDKRVRKIDCAKMPIYIKDEVIDSYKGAISINNKNYIYSENNKPLFELLDGFLISFVKNQDVASFKELSDLTIIENNILKLLNIYFEQAELYQNKVPVQLLYETVNNRIKIDKLLQERVHMQETGDTNQ